MVGRRRRGEALRHARYDEPTDFPGLYRVALASIVHPAEGYVFGIDCVDHRLLLGREAKLVLTNERVIAFSPQPAAPLKRTHRLDTIERVEFDTGLFTAETTLHGSEAPETYPVPKRLGREFTEAVRARLE